MQKQPLTHPELTKLQDEYMSSNSHDNLLFFVILLVSFHALMCLGKLVWLDKPCIISQKVSTHDSIELLPKGFFFFLLGHKADCFFEGNRVILQYNSSGDDPDEPFQKYLKSCSLLFPFHPQLWLHEDGTIPTHSWFIHQFCHHFPSDITGVWLPRRIRTVFFWFWFWFSSSNFFKKIPHHTLGFPVIC